MQLIVKAADVSHPSRALPLHIEWSRRICEEFYCQGDKEKSKGVKVSPLCDRNTPASQYPQGQLGFINFVAKPVFSLLSAVVTVEDSEKPWIKCMEENISYWETKKKDFL